MYVPHIYTDMHPYKNTYIHTYKHTYTHTHIHTHRPKAHPAGTRVWVYSAPEHRWWAGVITETDVKQNMSLVTQNMSLVAQV